MVNKLLVYYRIRLDTWVFTGIFKGSSMHRSIWIISVILSSCSIFTYCDTFPLGESTYFSNERRNLIDLERNLYEEKQLETIPEDELQMTPLKTNELIHLLEGVKDDFVLPNYETDETWNQQAPVDPIIGKRLIDAIIQMPNQKQILTQLIADTADSVKNSRSLSNELNCHPNNLRICGHHVIHGFKHSSDFLTKCGIRKQFLDCMITEREKGCTNAKALNIPEEFVEVYRKKIKDLLSSSNGCLLAYEM